MLPFFLLFAVLPCSSLSVSFFFDFNTASMICCYKDLAKVHRQREAGNGIDAPHPNPLHIVRGDMNPAERRHTFGFAITLWGVAFAGHLRCFFHQPISALLEKIFYRLKASEKFASMIKDVYNRGFEAETLVLSAILWFFFRAFWRQRWEGHILWRLFRGVVHFDVACEIHTVCCSRKSSTL